MRRRPVGSTWLEPGDVVAESRRARGSRRRGSPRIVTSGASASASGADELAGARARTRWRARALRVRRGTARSRCAPPALGRSAMQRRERRARALRRARGRDAATTSVPAPCSAWASRSSAAAAPDRRRRRAKTTSRSLGPAKPSMPTTSRDLALGLLHVEVSRADDDVDAGDGLGAVGERGDRLRAAHAVDALDAAQSAGAEDGRDRVADAARRRADGDVDHAGRAGGDDAHHDGARVRRAAARHVDRGRSDRHLAQR